MFLFPKEEYGSTYQIPFDEFYKNGYRGILFDIDNTLVPHNAPVDWRARKLCSNLKEMGYQVCLISNNKEPRVKPLADDLGVAYIHKADKPSRKGYRLAMENMGLTKDEVLVVGDQLLTDIWGANRAQIYSLLVAPINPKEEIQIVLKRFLEKIVLVFYRRSRQYKGCKPDRRSFESNIPEEYR